MNNSVVKSLEKTLSGVIPSGGAAALDDLPLLAWDKICAASPPKIGLFGKQQLMLPITASRGCPYSCFNYRVYPLQQGWKVRAREPQKIVDEMDIG